MTVSSPLHKIVLRGMGNKIVFQMLKYKETKDDQVAIPDDGKLHKKRVLTGRRQALDKQTEQQ